MTVEKLIKIKSILKDGDYLSIKILDDDYGQTGQVIDGFYNQRKSEKDGLIIIESKDLDINELNKANIHASAIENIYVYKEKKLYN